jgi:trk system potassium uptake protein TrkH
VTTGGLLAAGFVLAAAFEWENTLAGEPVHVRLMGALFLSVTARTAGFHTVMTGQLTNLALVTVSVLMVIGASPGSTGGGVKTTSFAIVWARVKSHVMNREHTEMLGRSVPREIAAKAMAVMMLYAVAATVAVLLLQATEFGTRPHEATRSDFLDQAFEVVSALSTVGLSTGLTPRLSDGGCLVLMLCMFVGRIGPLVLASSVVGERRRLPYAQPEGDVVVG